MNILYIFSLEGEEWIKHLKTNISDSKNFTNKSIGMYNHRK